MNRILWCAILIVFASGCAGSMGETSLGDFESGIGKWTATDNAKAEAVAENASQGKRSLKVDFAPGGYPGVGLALGDADWSGYDALRFDVFNPSDKPLKLNMRIDDMASTNYGTRFNLDDGLPVKPGKNSLELPMAALWTGTLLSRGLDVAHLREARFFMGNPKEPVTLYFDNIRLVKHDVKAGTVALIEEGKTKYELAKGTTGLVLWFDRPKPGDKFIAQLTLGTDSSYPGITFTHFMPNWLGYDVLAFDVLCPEEKPEPTSLSIKITAGDGTKQTLSTGLKKGKNRIRLNLGIAGFTSLGDVREFVFFTGKTVEEQSVTFSDPVIEKGACVETTEVHDEPKEGDRMVLDFKALERVGRNTCFSAIVWVPTEKGNRIVRVNAPNRGPLSYGLRPTCFKGAKPDATVEVWAFFLDHGVWQWTRREVALPTGKETVRVEFTDAKEFAH